MNSLGTVRAKLILAFGTLSLLTCLVACIGISALVDGNSRFVSYVEA